MEQKEPILEHEILKVLYVKTSMYIGGYTRRDGKEVIIAKRDYSSATLDFGTLVDIVNSPEKYADKKSFTIDLTKDEITTNTYNFGQVSNAIEVLVFNEQVIDKVIENSTLQSGSRKITLTKKGAIDYRDMFYLKEQQKNNSILINYDIQKKDRWLKKYWYLVEIAKYIMGGIIGAAITLAVVRINKSPESKSGNNKMTQEDTGISYTKCLYHYIHHIHCS